MERKDEALNRLTYFKGLRYFCYTIIHNANDYKHSVTSVQEKKIVLDNIVLHRGCSACRHVLNRLII
jgi:DNA-directed RNA polymerase subunit N (RpoN/RPB10)